MIELPEPVKKLLIDLRSSNPQELYNYVKKLREAQWPLRSIADVLGVSRTAVAKWETKGETATTPEVPETPMVEPSQRTRSSKKYFPSPEEIAELQELSSQARLVRRFTDFNAPSRKASEELSALLNALHLKGTTLRELATICGVSRASISERIRNES